VEEGGNLGQLKWGDGGVTEVGDRPPAMSRVVLAKSPRKKATQKSDWLSSPRRCGELQAMLPDGVFEIEYGPPAKLWVVLAKSPRKKAIQKLDWLSSPRLHGEL
jgi:hypothetical protein